MIIISYLSLSEIIYDYKLAVEELHFSSTLDNFGQYTIYIENEGYHCFAHTASIINLHKNPTHSLSDS